MFKKDEELRLCVDYHELNKFTIKNRHRLPLISETLNQLSDSKVFTKMNLKDLYHRLRIRKNDEWKTAFRTRYDHFEYMIMSFDLVNVSATFQTYINRALTEYVNVFCVVYLNDILVYSETSKLHWNHVRKILKRLRKFQLFVNLKKCDFSTNRVKFLDFIISVNEIAMNQSRVTAIAQWSSSKTYREIQVFLNFVNFYRWFIERYSQVASSMTDLLKDSKNEKKSDSFDWSVKTQMTFDQLLVIFTSTSILIHFDFKNRSRVKTDASEYAVANIFSQLSKEAQWHSVAFWSRKMISVEQVYETHVQELLVIVIVFKHWCHYFEDSLYSIEILIDHNNLWEFMNVKVLNDRQVRWVMRLASFDFSITHRSGKINLADASSRRSDYKSVNKIVSKLLSTLQRKLTVLSAVLHDNLHLDLDVIRVNADRMSVDLKRIKTSLFVIEFLKSSDDETSTQSVRSVALTLNSAAEVTDCKQYISREVVMSLTTHETIYDSHSKSTIELISDLQRGNAFVKDKRKALETIDKQKKVVNKSSSWMFDFRDLLRYNELLYVSEEESLRAELVKRHHDDILASHFEVEKTIELIERKYYWKGISQSIKNYVSTCDICQRVKTSRHCSYEEMQALSHSRGSWQKVTMNFIIELSPSKRKDVVYDTILVIVDRYTKMTRYLPTNKTITAERLADLFFEEIIYRFNTSIEIVTDWDFVFTSAYWSELCYCMKVKRRLSIAFHPQTDGQTERQNQTLEHYLRVFCNNEQDNWANSLPLAEFVYQTSFHASTRCGSFYAGYDYNPSIHYDVEDDFRKEEVPAAKDKVKKIDNMREALTQRWQGVVEAQAKHYNQKHKPQHFNVDDLVVLSAKNLRQKRPSKKLSHRYIEPFQVQNIVEKQAYRLTLPDTYRIHSVFHVFLLEPYHRRADNSSISELHLLELIDNDEQYEVEEILNRKKFKEDIFYKVKWLEWSEEYNQWLFLADVEEASELRQAYENFVLQKSVRKRRRKSKMH